jgi:hypothetical protein
MTSQRQGKRKTRETKQKHTSKDEMTTSVVFWNKRKGRTLQKSNSQEEKGTAL